MLILLMGYNTNVIIIVRPFYFVIFWELTKSTTLCHRLTQLSIYGILSVQVLKGVVAMIKKNNIFLSNLYMQLFQVKVIKCSFVLLLLLI